jgi:hypothetical protein
MGVRAPQTAEPRAAEGAAPTWAAAMAAWAAMRSRLAQAVPQPWVEAAIPAAQATVRAWVARPSLFRPPAGIAARATPEATRVALQPAAERVWAEPPRVERPKVARPRVARARAEPQWAEPPWAEPRPQVALAVPRPRAGPTLRARVLCLATPSLAPEGKSACRESVNVRPEAPFAVESVWRLLICRPIPPIVGQRVAVLPVGQERLVLRASAVARPRGKRLVLGAAPTYRQIPKTAASALRFAPAVSVRRGSVAR